MTLVIALVLAFVVLTVAGIWKTFKKAGRPGWATLIPIYNLLVIAKISGKSVWWALLMCIPYINWVFGILVYAAMARRFGKSDGFGLGLMFLPFIYFPILGFGKAVYQDKSPLETLNDVFA